MQSAYQRNAAARQESWLIFLSFRFFCLFCECNQPLLADFPVVCFFVSFASAISQSWLIFFLADFSEIKSKRRLQP